MRPRLRKNYYTTERGADGVMSKKRQPPNLEIRVPPSVQLGGYSLYRFHDKN